MTHRVGIIGLGTVGSRFVEQFNLHPAFELVAAWDPSDAARAEHANAVSIVGGAGEVVDTSDLVYIAVPPFFHREYAMQCIDAGTAVFCEKPLGIDVHESRALVEAVERSGLPAGVNFVFGGAPSARELEQLVSGGALGDVVSAELRLHFAQWPRAWHAKAEWLKLRDQGGWVREVVSHFLFVAERVLGPLRLVSSELMYPDGLSGVACEVDGIARFDAGGTPLLVLGTSEGGGGDIVDLTVRGRGSAARIWDWYRLQTDSGDGVWVDQLGDDRATLGVDAYASQLDQLAAMMDGRPHTIATFQEALAVQELVEEMLR